jgi:thiol:disulfide interchange protein DsbC
MNILRLLFIITGLSLGLNAVAATPAKALTPSEVQEKLNQIRPDLPIKKVVESSLPGFYEVTLLEGTRLFVDKSGSYFVAGDLYRIEPTGFVNVSEESRNVIRKELIAALDEADMVIFSPPEGMKKTSITVFTDIDCGYCRKLHKEVPELNRLGIEVRYLAYPRSGIGTKSYDKYVSAWCADNNKLAITRAKLGEELEERTCENPIAEQYALGNELGVTGTPALVFEDGTLQPGYLPAEKLAERLGIL